MALLAEDNKLGKGDPVGNIARGCTVRIQPTRKRAKSHGAGWLLPLWDTLRSFIPYELMILWSSLIHISHDFAAKGCGFGSLARSDVPRWIEFHKRTWYDDWGLTNDDSQWTLVMQWSDSDYLGLWWQMVSTCLDLTFCHLLSRREAFDFRFRKAWCIRSVCQAARFAMKFQVGSGDMTGVLSQVRLCRPSPFMFLSALD